MYSLLKVFGFLVFLPKQLSLLGKRLGVRFSLLTIYEEEGGSYPLDATCVEELKRRFTISSCTALLLDPFGTLFFSVVGVQWVFPSWLRRL